jgi:hypothetical protein
VAPPVPIPNTAVKRCSPDGSTAIGRARVGRRQNREPVGRDASGLFVFVVTPTRAENGADGSRATYNQARRAQRGFAPGESGLELVVCQRPGRPTGAQAAFR